MTAPVIPSSTSVNTTAVSNTGNGGISMTPVPSNIPSNMSVGGDTAVSSMSGVVPITVTSTTGNGGVSVNSLPSISTATTSSGGTSMDVTTVPSVIPSSISTSTGGGNASVNSLPSISTVTAVSPIVPSNATAASSMSGVVPITVGDEGGNWLRWVPTPSDGSSSGLPFFTNDPPTDGVNVPIAVPLVSVAPSTAGAGSNGYNVNELFWGDASASPTIPNTANIPVTIQPDGSISTIDDVGNLAVPYTDDRTISTIATINDVRNLVDRLPGGVTRPREGDGLMEPARAARMRRGNDGLRIVNDEINRLDDLTLPGTRASILIDEVQDNIHEANRNMERLDDEIRRQGIQELVDELNENYGLDLENLPRVSPMNEARVTPTFFEFPDYPLDLEWVQPEWLEPSTTSTADMTESSGSL